MLTESGRVVLGFALFVSLSVVALASLFMVISAAPEGVNDFVLAWGAGLLLSVVALVFAVRSSLLRGLAEQRASRSH